MAYCIFNLLPGTPPPKLAEASLRREGPVGTVPGGGRGAAGRASGRPQLGSWSASLAEGCALLPRLEPLPNPKPSFRPGGGHRPLRPLPRGLESAWGWCQGFRRSSGK